MTPVVLGLLAWLGFNVLVLATASCVALTGSDSGGSSKVNLPTQAPRQGQPFAPDGPVGGPVATPSGAAISNATVLSSGIHLGDVRGHRGEHKGESR